MSIHPAADIGPGLSLPPTQETALAGRRKHLNRADVAADALHWLREAAESQTLNWARRCWDRFNSEASGRSIARARRGDIGTDVRRIRQVIDGNRTFRSDDSDTLKAKLDAFLSKLEAINLDAETARSETMGGDDGSPVQISEAVPGPT